MRRIKNSSGFTLIELIVVIVILGILAVAAAPRFININTDANISTLKGLESNLLSAAQLVYSKAIIEDLQSEASAQLDFDNDGVGDIDIEFGYPSDDRATGIVLAMDSSFPENWAWSTNNGPQRVVITSAGLTDTGNPGQRVNGVPITSNDCYLTYIGATAAGESPTVTLTTSGC
jgi:MSHA pilin protein MshA